METQTEQTEQHVCLIDLPGGFLIQLVEQLGTEDKKNLALTNTQFRDLVRPTWKTIRFGLHSERPVPSGLAKFKGLRTVIWIDDHKHVDTASDDELVHNPSMAAPRETFAPLCLCHTKRLARIHEMLYDATLIEASTEENPAADRRQAGDVAARILESLKHVPLVDLSPDQRQSLGEDLIKPHAPRFRPLHLRIVGSFWISSQHLTELLLDTMPFGLKTYHSLKLFVNTLGTQAESTKKFLEAEVEAHGNAQDDAASGELSDDVPDLLEHPSGDRYEASTGPSRSDDDARDEDDYGQQSFEDSDDEFDSLVFDDEASFFALRSGGDTDSEYDDHDDTDDYSDYSGSGDDSSEEEEEEDEEDQHYHHGGGLIPPNGNLLVNSFWMVDMVKPTLTMYSTIDAGWFEANGTGLEERIVKATCSWCPHHRCELADYPKIHTLQLTTSDCDADEDEMGSTFRHEISRVLGNMASLRELHLGRTLFDEYLEVDARTLDLPSLTRLVLNEKILFSNWESFTTLSSLKSLSVAFPDAAATDGHPQDFGALAALSTLRSLHVAYWRVTEPQQDAVASLTQLTELSLQHLEGKLHLIRPAAPMPNLLDVSLSRVADHPAMRYKEDSKFARWALRKAAPLFPSAEVIHLGTLGSAPSSIANVKELEPAAEIVDAHVIPFLEQASPALLYLQLDTVMEYADTETERRCETGVFELSREFSVVRRGQRQRTEGGCAVSLPRHQHRAGLLLSPGDSIADEEEEEEDDLDDNEQQIGGTMTHVERDGDRGAGLTGFLAAVRIHGDEGEGAAPGSSRGEVVQWERTVEFALDPLTQVLVAQFHYSRRKAGTSEE